MKNLIKTVSFLAIMTVIPVAFGATSRVSVTTKATTRYPSIAGHLTNPLRSVIATGTTAASLMANSECINSYKNCVFAPDVCGTDFEECPTRFLFHNKMPKCDHILIQCSASGIMDLFGTTAISALGQPILNATNTEVVDYVYPTISYGVNTDGTKYVTSDSSLVGRWIGGGYGNNLYGLAECRKKYERCLLKDDVCGEDFELCTNQTEFKVQAMKCASHLARCGEAGRAAFYCSLDHTATQTQACKDGREIDGASLIQSWINSGLNTAALNAVNTCYKVADRCILDACSKNPAKCIEGEPLAAALMIDNMDSSFLTDNASSITGKAGEQNVKEGQLVSSSDTLSNYIDTIKQKLKDSDNPKDSFWTDDSGDYKITAKYVKRYIKNMCREKIGTNRFCFMTANGREPTKKTDLTDVDNMEEVYGTIYADRFNGSMREKLNAIIEKYDAKASANCVDTIKNCVMRTCGGGSGAVCYQQSYDSTNGVSINGKNTYNEIKMGCRAIVNMDPYCAYIAEKKAMDNSAVTYDSDSTDVFAVLFPEYNSDIATIASDPIGAVGMLNKSLATSFSPKALEQLTTDCKNTAKSCVKTMCGANYENCFRNRTDIMSDMYTWYNGEDSQKNPDGFNHVQQVGSGFADSMNKMGGLLDYTVVTGLCYDVVTGSEACAESFKVAAARQAVENNGNVWGQSQSVSSDWIGTKVVGSHQTGKYVTGCRISKTIGNCKEGSISNLCGLNADGCNYDEEMTDSYESFVVKKGAETLFADILQGEERIAQSQEKARQTRLANRCKAMNQDGLSGNESTYAWVKPKGTRLPQDYTTKGFQPNQLTISNDVYNSFCRVKVTLLADTQELNEMLAKESEAYFAVGSPIVCGSWLSSATVNEVADNIREKAGGEWKLSSKKGIAAMVWSTVGGFALGGGAGGLITKYLQKKEMGGDISSLWANEDIKQNYSDKTNAGSCAKNIEACLDGTTSKCREGLSDARAANIDSSLLSKLSGISFYSNGSNEDIDRKKCRKCVQADSDNRGKVCSGSDGSYNCRVSDVESELSEVRSACISKNAENIRKNNSGNMAAGVLLGGAATAALAGGVTATVFKLKEEEAKNKAEKEFRESLSKHLNCYVGPDYVAPFLTPFGLTVD